MKTLKDKYELTKAFYAIGIVYMKQRKYSKALSYYQKSLEYANEFKKHRFLPGILKDIGFTLAYQNKPKEAYDYYQKSVSLAQEMKDSLNLALGYSLLGRLKRQEKDYESSIDYYLQSLPIIEKLNKKSIELSILEALASTYSKANKHKKANEYYGKYNNLRNQIEKNYRKAINYEDAYKTEKHKRELLEEEQKLEKSQNRQKTIFIYALSVGIVLLIGVFLSIIRAYKSRQITLETQKKLKEREDEIEDLLVNQELKTMGAMIEGQENERKRIAQDLHDRLGSLLAVIKLNFQAVDQQLDLLKEQNKEQYLQAHKLLDEAADEVHKVAHDMASGLLTKFGLVPALENMRQAITKTNLLDIHLVDVGFDNRRLESSTEIAVYRIIQELMGNVLKHAEATNVEIQLFWKKGGLNIIVEDNGKGFDIEQANFASGMGLRNIRSRVERLNGELTIDSKIRQGSTFIIDIPL